MTTTIDWVHEIDASLDGIDDIALPAGTFALRSRIVRWHRQPVPLVDAFADYVAERGPHVRRLAHAICCDWAQAEALVLATFTSLYDVWHRVSTPDEADAFVYRSLGGADVTDSTTPRSCNAHGVDYPIEDESLLFDGLQSLTTVQRKAVVLHDWLDLPAEEVADAIGISPELVALHAARGHTALNFLLPDSA